jgi:hypothetical protein
MPVLQGSPILPAVIQLLLQINLWGSTPCRFLPVTYFYLKHFLETPCVSSDSFSILSLSTLVYVPLVSVLKRYIVSDEKQQKCGWRCSCAGCVACTKVHPDAALPDLSDIVSVVPGDTACRINSPATQINITAIFDDRQGEKRKRSYLWTWIGVFKMFWMHIFEMTITYMLYNNSKVSEVTW